MDIETYRKFAELLPEAVLLVSGEGAILSANGAVRDRLGIEPRALEGRRLDEVTADRPQWVAEYLRACARSRSPVPGRLGLKVEGGEAVGCRCDGGMLAPKSAGAEALLMIRLTPRKAATGQFVALNRRIIELHREVVRRHNAERALADQRERLRVTLASIGDAVIATDGEGRIEFMNPVAEALTGWPSAEASGRPLGEVFRIVNQDTRAPAEGPVAKVLREGAVVGLANHTLLIARDGREVPIDDSGAPIRDGDGRVVGVVLVFRDVAEQRRAEDERARLYEQLESERARLEAVLRQMPGGVVIAEAPSGRVVLRNALAERFTGGEDPPPQSLEDYERFEGLFPDPRFPTAKEWPLLRALTRGEVVEGEELAYRRPDGGRGVIRASAAPILDARGRAVAAVTTFADVTEQKRAEQALRFLADASAELSSSLDYEATLASVARLAVPTVADWCVVDMVEPDGSLRRLAVAHVDPSKVELAYELDRRYPPDPASPHGPPEVVRTGRPEMMAEIAEEAVVASARDAEHARIMVELGLKSYISVPLAARGRVLGVITLITAESGRRYGPADLALAEQLAHRAALAVDNARLYREATESARRAEESLALLDTVMQTAPVGLAFIDRDLRYVRLNEALATIDGIRREDAVGRPLAEVVPELFPRIESFYRRILDGGEPIIGVEVGGETPASPGERRDWLVDYFPVRTPGGEVLGVGVVVNEITERKRAERELIQARDAAESASEAKSQFLAVLSHELRTPLTPVLAGVSAMIDDPDTPPEVRPTLEMARRNIELEARLIDDLLDVTRIMQGKLRLSPEVVDAQALILRAVGICRGDIHAAGLRLDLDFAAAEHYIEADPARLQQVFWNLIKNAVKFTPEGGSLAIRTRNGPAPGGGRPTLLAEVADTGAGIDPADLTRIFDAFEQGRTSAGHRFGGLGLGLAISRSVVALLGGRLSVESPGLDRGATFTVELATVPAPAPAADRPEPAGGGSAESRPLSILLVEDNPDTLHVMARLLRGRGHSVEAAATVAEALGHNGRAAFDLLVSDIGLPDGSGLDLVRRLKDERPDLKAIALSGFGMDRDLRLGREAGFDAHLIKPIDFPRLEATIRQVAADADAGPDSQAG